MKIWVFNAIPLFLIIFTSCNEKLDDLELEVIHKEIPSEIYMETSLQSAETLDDYIFDGIQEYADAMKIQVKQEIQKHRQSVAMFGDWEIGSAVFGEPSKEEKLANKYNSYINYVNHNRQKIYKVIIGIAQIIAKDPTILTNISSSENVINLDAFSDLEYVPTSMSQDTYNKYLDIPMNTSDRYKWGEVILPYSNKPSIQFDALTIAVIKMMKNISFPKAVYAVYNKELKAWNVGYDTEQAYLITFILDNDVENWEIEETKYVGAYINSKGNILKK